jgi:hypothetical protein
MYQALYELVYNDLVAKQSDISRLFPQFKQRVKDVAVNGGSEIQRKTMSPNRWEFEVSSGTKTGVSYTVYVQWVNPEETLEKLVPDKSLWKKDMSGVNLMKLALKFMHECDMKIWCSCPAFQYWGPAYILSQSDAKYTEPELRSPDERNPSKHGAYCKHAQLMMSTLHAHSADCAKWLRDNHSKTINEIEAQNMRGIDKSQPDEQEAGPKQPDEQETDPSQQVG